MVIIITGATHSGKTPLAQRLLEKYKYPYLSIDHLKMGLIRSGQTKLTPADDEDLREYLWPIVREIIKTVVENKQNLIIEGSYIPYKWDEDFSRKYLDNIKCYCLLMTEDYIKNNFDNIKSKARIIEDRLDDKDLNLESLLADNKSYEKFFENKNVQVIVIDKDYKIDLERL